MNHTYIKHSWMIAATLFFLSCGKKLNVYPSTSEVDGQVITDVKSATAVLNGVYGQFASSGSDNNGVQSVNWSAVNEVIPSEMANSLIDNEGDDGVYSLSLDASNYAAYSLWKYGYDIVNAANGLLKNIAPVTSISDSIKNQMTAEAKFLRAFANTELLLYFGQYYDPSSKYGIIIRNEFTDAQNVSLPRSGVADSYAAILSDLDAAIAGLAPLNTQIIYTNRSAARLLKARLLINRGASGDYDSVINLTNQIRSDNNFSLEPNNKDLFLTKGFTSKEVLLAVQPTALQDVKFYNFQTYGFYSSSKSFTSLLLNDPRSQWVNRYDNKGTQYGTIASASPLYELSKYYSGPVVNPVQNPLSEDCYAFRLTEAYLLQAEAICLENGDLNTAKSLLKTVETAAGITDFTAIDNASSAADLQTLIVTEEIKNFVSENGADWFALRRLPLSVATTLQPNLTTIHLLLPIPLSETTTNSAAIQNPGY